MPSHIPLGRKQVAVSWWRCGILLSGDCVPDRTNTVWGRYTRPFPDRLGTVHCRFPDRLGTVHLSVPRPSGDGSFVFG